MMAENALPGKERLPDVPMPGPLPGPQPEPEEKEPEKIKCHSLLEYLFFKIDRTIAICGLIAIAVLSISAPDIPETSGKVI